MTPSRQHDRFAVEQLSPELRRDAAPHLCTTSKPRAFLAIGMSLFVFALAVPSVLGDCKCHRPEKDDKTREGANIFEISVEKEAYRMLEGTVVGMGDNRFIEDALVEVFDHPEYLLSENPQADHVEQKRVAACHTPADGKFCFRRLPPGKYELRSSLEAGWNITHIYVVVNKKGQTKQIQVRMTLGT
jgi:hypothetical protein